MCVLCVLYILCVGVGVLCASFGPGWLGCHVVRHVRFVRCLGQAGLGVHVVRHVRFMRAVFC